MKCWWCNGTGSVGFLHTCGECDGEGWVRDDYDHQDSDDSIYDHLADHYDSKDYEANKTDDIPYQAVISNSDRIFNHSDRYQKELEI